MWAILGLCVALVMGWSLLQSKSWTAKGKNVLITGGSQGLGLALAKRLASHGANVVICSRSEAKLQAATKEVETIAYVSADVSTFQGAAEALAKCPTTPDTVFCCAGGAKPGLFVEQTEADFQAAVRTDYFTALATAHGRIVLVSSVMGFMGLVGYSQYSPMKYAIRGLAECLRSEFGLYGLTVQTYFPATILSPGFDEENKTKPQVTKDIEGADDQKTPEQCAEHLERGVEAGHFSITDGLVGMFLRISSGGSAPGNGLLVDSLLFLPARLALLVWRRFVADRTVAQYRKPQ